MNNIAPTKTNLLKLKDDLKFARLGYELLDQKRNILVLELLNLVDQAVDVQAGVDAAIGEAFHTFTESTLSMGKRQVLHLANAINVETEVTLRGRKVMGVQLPIVETGFIDHFPHYSPMDTSFWIDASVNSFKEALRTIGRLAELKVSIMRLADEVRKTIRKVNALEKIAIPDLEESVDYIRNRLEENERDMFILMKLVKNRLEKEKNADK